MFDPSTSAQSARLGSSANPGRPLERIGLAADRAMHAVRIVEEFLDRFHGPTPAAGSAGGVGPEAIAVSYSNNLDRLFANLDLLEQRLSGLSQIG